MTAFATIIGAVPLLIATGPGAAARQSLGTAIVGGMWIATVLSLFVVPVLYITIKSIASRYDRKKVAAGDTPDGSNDGNGSGHPPGETAAEHYITSDRD
jgi:HAE1 family hydrophobic/amphiphilic exporter-1